MFERSALVLQRIDLANYSLICLVAGNHAGEGEAHQVLQLFLNHLRLNLLRERVLLHRDRLGVTLHFVLQFLQLVRVFHQLKLTVGDLLIRFVKCILHILDHLDHIVSLLDRQVFAHPRRPRLLLTLELLEALW